MLKLTEVKDRCFLDYESAKDWYMNYGWHMVTRLCGHILLQEIPFENAGSKESAVNSLLDRKNLSIQERDKIAEQAVHIRMIAEEVNILLKRAIGLWEIRDLTNTLATLTEASLLELEHGNDPATQQLKKQLICEDTK